MEEVDLVVDVEEDLVVDVEDDLVVDVEVLIVEGVPPLREAHKHLPNRPHP